MYIPTSNAEPRPEVIHDFLDAHPFAALITASPDTGIHATHLPFILHRARGEYGTLEGHLARSNPHHRQPPAAETEALIIFTGPDAYITPSWYPAKAEHGRVVPTWNYVAVHVYGTLRWIEDPAFLRRHLEELTTRHEAGRPNPWSVSDAPPEYVAQLQRAIVGVELTITRLEGKWKMSQNRSDADIDGVVQGLGSSPDAGDREVARIVAERRPTRPA
ncbi:MAG TPA: FMN-binding negative transcriptional regulator [Gemmatimonadaceae bacterium]|nr:FMN-binding negative transcriptional regulator [Gemmatimonadaceae bacterium]